MEVSRRMEEVTQSVLGASGAENEFCCDTCEHDGHHVSAVGYCVDCQEFLCSACYKVHCRPAVWRHHHLQDKHSMPKVKPASTVTDVCTEICQKHNKIIEYFCNYHESFGCPDCITTSHRNCHKVDFIPESAATFSSSWKLEELQRKLSELFTMNETTKSKISKMSRMVVLQAERAKLHVQNLRAKVAELFDMQEKKINESIEDLKGGDEKKMAELDNATDAISHKLQTHITEIESCLIEKKICKLFLKAKRLKEPLSILSEEVSSIGESCEIQDYQFTPDPFIVDMIKTVKKFGVLETMDQHAKVPKFEREINVRTDTDECECEITGIAVLSERLVVIVDSMNRSIKLIDVVKNGIKYVYKLEDTSLFDVAKVDVAQIAVTYPYDRKIQFLDISESGSMTMQREINANGIECFGIECMGDNLIVSYNKPPAVKVLKMTGEVIREIDLIGNYRDTDYVAVNPQKNLVYISNWDIHAPGSVACFTLDGSRQAFIKDEKLYGPHGISVDTLGMVYVCGRRSHNVVLLSEDCTMIQELLNETDGLENPLCLALSSQDDQLYIGMNGDNIKVYKLY